MKTAMSKNRSMVRRVALTGLAVALAACQGAPEPDGEPGLAESGDAPEVELRVLAADEAGVPTFLSGRLGEIARPGSAGDMDLAGVLDRLAPMVRADPSQLLLEGIDTDPLGDVHYRLSQTRDGLEVLGGELILHARGGVVYAANGSVRADLPVSAGAALSPDDAIEAAIGEASDLSDLSVESRPELAYLPTEEALELVYRVDIAGVRRDGVPVEDTLLVRAADGVIATRIPHVHSALNRELHDAQHGTSLPGPTVRTEGAPPTADAVVNTNYTLLGATHACYQQLFGRDSYDNAGAKLVSSVHFGASHNNAYWYDNLSQMVYGDGDGVLFGSFATSMDVTAHELTHAVTSRTSNLAYYGQSGGLNEAMSDIFGNVCEWHRSSQVVNANTWKVGEDIYTPGVAGDALRYMKTPRQDGRSLDWFPDYSSGVDVHYSSGIANLAFYLLSQGGGHPRGKTSSVMTGVGIAKAAQIFYRANAFLMTSNTTFAGAKAATEQAALDLGYDLAERSAVTAAWQNVGVGATGNTCGHNLCTEGAWLQPGCDPGACAASVCSTDPYCCSYGWDDICVDEASSLCGVDC